MRAMSWRPALFLRKGTSLTFSSNFALGSYPVFFFAAAMPVTLAAAMAVIPLRTVRRVSFMNSSCVQILRSFDHFVGAQHQLLGDRNTECLGRLEIDHQIELRRLLERQITGLCALQDFVHIGRCSPVLLEDIGTVAHQRTGSNELTIG